MGASSRGLAVALALSTVLSASTAAWAWELDGGEAAFREWMHREGRSYPTTEEYVLRCN
jgi:hypothetical protein